MSLSEAPLSMPNIWWVLAGEEVGKRAEVGYFIVVLCKDKGENAQHQEENPEEEQHVVGDTKAPEKVANAVAVGVTVKKERLKQKARRRLWCGTG